MISIHASRGGSDELYLRWKPKHVISIHASRGGSDMQDNLFSGLHRLFQSTLPAGEATRHTSFNMPCPMTISIHASRGGSDKVQFSSWQLSAISIHASRGGSDESKSNANDGFDIFQSTLPAGEATKDLINWVATRMISIHASRGGSDDMIVAPGMLTIPISIHASRGGSDVVVIMPSTVVWKFQSTLPAGEATRTCFTLPITRTDFNPRFPRGKRLNALHDTIKSEIFQSTLPAGEATSLRPSWLPCMEISIHASRGGSDFL